MKTYAFTCASCHFGQAPDGSYSVGLPNHNYDYGGQLLALNLFPQMVMPIPGSKAPHPAAAKALKPLVDEFNKLPVGLLQFGWSMLPLVSQMGNVPQMTDEIQAAYASWLPGTQDFVMYPVPVDDMVHVVGRILSVWRLPSDEEVKAAKMPHMMLGWGGTTASLHNFINGFSVLSGGKKIDPLRKKALFAYIKTLSAPKNPDPPPAHDVDEGAKLFVSRGCTSCHNGPRLMGTKVYSFQEIGTADALAKWNDADGDGMADAPALLGPGDKLTGGVKAPRLNGMWAKKRFLHNGSLSSLEELFCLEGQRPTSTDPVFGDGGHMMTCDGLTVAERKHLIAFLRSR
ncbi:MAG TPA: hypothetical protein DCQ06_08165 [Myxococcales bacterium]|nr:hypothetical protein [Myxococcales bacterium]